jgi:hypothetical protein
VEYVQGPRVRITQGVYRSGVNYDTQTDRRSEEMAE